MGTLFTRIVRADGSPAYPTELVIRPVRGPVARGGGVKAAEDLLAVTDVTGFVTQPLLGGDYRIWIGSGDPRTFTMPDDDATHLLEDLLGGPAGSLALNYRYQGSVLQLINGTTGFWHTVRIAGDPTPQITIGLPDTDITTQNYSWEMGAFYLWNASADEWQQIYVTGSPTPQLAVAGSGDPVDANARINAGRLQIRNVTTSQYHTIFVTGAGPAYTLAIGSGEA
jgi:hypothetical protein